MTTAELQAQRTVLKSQLDAIGAAIIALADPTVQSYSIDSGQTVQRVSRENLPELIERQGWLMNMICMIDARLSGSNVVKVDPAW